MSLLHPWALALSALAIVPLALHLVRRETRRRVPFPALRYLRSAERRHARSLKVRDRWLVAARVALLLCLAAAASRPLVGRGGPASHPPTDLALVIDNTASMQRVTGDLTLLDAALETARRTLGHATPDDRFWVATPVDGVLAAGVGPADARAALDAIRGSDAAGSLADAARDAASAMPADPDRAREVQLFTDAQRASLGRSAELDPATAVALFLVPAGAGTNAAVLDMAVHPAPPVPVGAPLTVTVRVGRWQGPETAGDAAAGRQAEGDGGGMPVRLLVNGELAAATRTVPGEDAVLAVPSPGPGAHVLRAEIDADGLRADDGRQVGIRVGEPVSVVVPAGPEAAFVARALETLVAAGRARALPPRGAAEVRFRIGEGRQGDVPPGARPPTLVLIPPAHPLGLPAFGQALASAGVPWRLEADPRRGELRLAGDVPGLDGVRVRSRYRLRRFPAPPTPFDSVLLRTDDDEPWAVRGRTPAGAPFVLLGSALVPEATDLPVGVAMVPFVETLIAAWSRAGAAPQEREAGIPTALPDRADSLAAPGGPARRVEGGSPWRPRTAGAWRLSIGPGDDEGAGRAWVGVNVPRAESDPAPAGPGEIAAALGVAGPRIVDRAGAWDAAAFATRRGREARPALLLLALALLAAEALLASPGARARGPVGAPRVPASPEPGARP